MSKFAFLSVSILVLIGFIMNTTQSTGADRPASAVESSKDTKPAEARPHSAPNASFFLIGGSADSTLKDFVRLAGTDAKIAIITHASSEPDKAGDELQNALTALGVKIGNTAVLLPGSKVGMPKDTKAVYICGGDQSRLKRLLDEPLLEQLASFDGLIGGSSAGAMIASPDMIAGGPGTTITGESLQIIKGLVFLPGIVVDTHVGQRSRDTRLAAALALIPQAQMAIGLDEDTAIHVCKGKVKVFGKGHVRVFTRGEGFSSSLPKAKNGAVANVKKVVVSFLCEGDEFDLPNVSTAAPASKK